MYKIVNGNRVYNVIYIVTYKAQEVENPEWFVDYSKKVDVTQLKNMTWQQAMQYCKKHFNNVISNKKHNEIIVK